MGYQEERRRYRRVLDQFNVRVIREVMDDHCNEMETAVAQTVNISGSGMLIHTTEQLDAREIVRVTFLKPNTFEFFKGLARVIRVDKNKDETSTVGMQFYNLSDSEMNNMDYHLSIYDRKPGSL